MKTLLAILLLVGSALAQQAAPPAAPAAPQSGSTLANENARKARGIIDDMIKALGGQAYLTIQDRTEEGRGYRYYRGTPSDGNPYWRMSKWPDKERQELTKDRDVIYIHNGDKGYEVTFRGTRPEDTADTEEFIRRREYSLEHVLREWLADPKVMLFYEGNALVDNKYTDKVSIMNSKRQSVTIYVDEHTRLPIKKSYEWRDAKTREIFEEGERFDNYRMVQGVNTPHIVLQTRNDEVVRQRYVEKISYNSGLADSLFQAKVTWGEKKKQ
jgi:hypothetical protein